MQPSTIHRAYPTHALGKTIEAAALAHSADKEVSLTMTSIAAVTVAAASVQDSFDVQRPDLTPSSIGVLCFVSAGSGEGKSTSSEVFLKPFEDVQSLMDGTDEDRVNFQADHMIWKEELRDLRTELRQCKEAQAQARRERADAKRADPPSSADACVCDQGSSQAAEAGTGELPGSGSGGVAQPNSSAEHLADAAKEDGEAGLQKKLQELREKIVTHLLDEPKRAAKTRLLYDHVTPTALRRNLRNWPSALIASVDADHVLNGKIGGDFDLVNSLWDGVTQRLDTVEETAVAYSPRLSALLFTQTKPTLRYWARRGEAAQSTGLFARVDWAVVPENSPFVKEPMDTAAISTFQARVADLLMSRIQDRKRGKTARTVVGFTQEGGRYFRAMYARVRGMSGPGGEWQHIRAYAAKLPERAARYACIIHTFNDLPGEISAETLSLAEQIAYWHAHQFQSLLFMTSPQAQAEIDATHLESLLVEAGQRGEPVRYADLSRVSPHDWNRPRRQRAWQFLVDQGRARISRWRNTLYVDLTMMGFPLIGFDRSHHLDMNATRRSMRAVAPPGNGGYSIVDAGCVRP